MLIQCNDNIFLFGDIQLQLWVYVKGVMITATASGHATPPIALVHFHRPSFRSIRQRQFILGRVRVQMNAFQIGECFAECQKRHPKFIRAQLAEQSFAFRYRYTIPCGRHCRPVAGVRNFRTERFRCQWIFQSRQLHRIAHRIFHFIQ